MIVAKQRGREDYMGFAWFEVFKNGKSSGNSYKALDADHAIAIYKQLNK